MSSTSTSYDARSRYGVKADTGSFWSMTGDRAIAARQKRITVDGDDYYLDLLFYNRKLRRLVAVEGKREEDRS